MIVLKEKWLNYWIFLRVTVIVAFDIGEKLTEMHIFVITKEILIHLNGAGNVRGIFGFC